MHLLGFFGYLVLVIVQALEYKKIWGKDTLFAARNCILNLPIRLNPVTRDSKDLKWLVQLFGGLTLYPLHRVQLGWEVAWCR